MEIQAVFKKTLGSLAVLPLLIVLPGCGKDQPKAAKAPPPAAQAAAADQYGGKVLETMDAGGYTYVQLGNNGKEIWVAGPQTPGIKVGDEISIPGQPLAMKDFHSNTLNRTFDVVYFASALNKPGEAAAAPQALPTAPAAGGGDAAAQPNPMAEAQAAAEAAASKVDLKGIAKAKGGMTIAEIFAAKDKLIGKDVTVRGRVVKVNPSIMGKNWMHIRDGSGSVKDKNIDLTVTTQENLPKIGDTVLVTGKVATDQDLGFGYKYDVLVEDAKLKVE